ncbi:putative reverse transcriptase domain-containing protein [Tanacetum coccineum]
MDLMNRECKPYLDKFVIGFIDDILIYSNSKEDHEVHLKLVMELLKKEKLFANKIESLKNWKIPKTPSKIRSFLGLARYYQHFISNFLKIAKPLTSLTQKNQKYKSGAKQEEAFQILKDNLCNALILSLPNGPDEFMLFSDYDCEIHYHPKKANVVADVLSRKERVKPRRACIMSMTIQSTIKDKILAAKSEVSKVENAPAELLRLLD